MVASSGSLGGGDDSSKLDALAKSIAENSEKLEILNKILSKVEDVGDSEKKKEATSTTDFLKNIEKIVSKQDIENARAASKSLQVDADRLAANTFRASETVISEVLSRLGGTSFYPALSAFRVARESVAAGTGTPQSELNVLDILSFVNDSTKELVGSFFGLSRATEEFSISAEQAKQDLVDINEALRPLTTEIVNEISSVMQMTQDEFSKLSIEDGDIQKLILYIEALRYIGEATEEQVDLLTRLYDELKDTGAVLDAAMEKNLRDTLKQEKEKLDQESPQLQNLVNEQRRAQFDERQKAFESARTIAGIAGLAVPVGFLLNNAQNLIGSISDLSSSLASSGLSVLTDPKGIGTFKAAVSPLPAVGQVAGNLAGIGGLIAGSLSPLGPIIGGPVGSFVGKTITDILFGPINIAANTLVSINDSVSQIVDDLVGFSPEVTSAAIGQELAILRDDFRRAAEVGPEIARITEAQTQLQLASRQAFDRFLEQTEPLLVGILDKLTSLLNNSSQYLPSIVSNVASIVPGVGSAVRLLSASESRLSEISNKLGTDDPIELSSIAWPERNNFFGNNQNAGVGLRVKDR